VVVPKRHTCTELAHALMIAHHCMNRGRSVRPAEAAAASRDCRMSRCGAARCRRGNLGSSRRRRPVIRTNLRRHLCFANIPTVVGITPKRALRKRRRFRPSADVNDPTERRETQNRQCRVASGERMAAWGLRGQPESPDDKNSARTPWSHMRLPAPSASLPELRRVHVRR
jgi:hypothetical protein